MNNRSVLSINDIYTRMTRRITIPPLLCSLLLALSVPALRLSVEAQGDVIISEFMADNATTLADEDGQFSDWIEIHNPTLNPINLLGYSLTDDPGLLTKWEFPAVTIPAGGYLLVFASYKNRVKPGEIGRAHV